MSFLVDTKFVPLALRGGRPVALADLFIAATALVYDLTIVTHNISDFKPVRGLRIQDWLDT
jgi:predicted nucleic acid-binding protein